MKIALLEQENGEPRLLVGELRGTVEQLRRASEEWKRGHRASDRVRHGQMVGPEVQFPSQS